MKKELFDYKDYKSYLEAYIRSQPKGGRGVRIALANFISSPVSHVSQVLNGNSQLTLEQGEAVNSFIGHTDEESHYFLLLIQLSRAGTSSLKRRFESQIQLILEKRLVLKDRLGVKQMLSKEDQVEFYSSWFYGAVHVMLTIPEFQTKESISRYLGLSLKKTNEILEFLAVLTLVPHEFI
jgi:uncharacterized protein (TIGR02147 family)